jgi:hypothetical protein
MVILFILNSAQEQDIKSGSHNSYHCHCQPSTNEWPPPRHHSQYINSSKTLEFSGRRREGYIVVRGKSLCGQNLIAEATKASEDVIVGQMREMAKASRELERSKIEVQLIFFLKQM